MPPASAVPLTLFQWSDFIGDFMSLTEGRLSPRLFRQWSGIALVAGALERRVWAKVGQNIVYPNLYTFLVATPGTGKSVIEVVRKLWTDTCEPGTKTPAFHVAPDQMTKAAMIDALAEARQIRLPPKGEPFQYHSMLMAAEEFSNFLPGYDGEFISTLVTLWGNKDLHKEVRRHGPAREVSIENPTLNLFGGVQPAWLGEVFPESSWNSGIGRRIIMVYSSEKPLVDIFGVPEEDQELRTALLRKLGLLSQLYGQCLWEPSAAERISEWHLAGGPPAPKHSKLASYVQTRTEFIEKLAIISAVSRSGKLVISRADAERAIEWLTDAERIMPDIFRAMIGKSDNQVIEELYNFATALWTKNKHQPINGEALRRFLVQRLPSDKIEKIIEVCEKANILQRVGGTQDLWLPSAKHDHGVE